MSVIYAPRGPAREYSKLALSLYKGCSHGCTYCFAPRFVYQMQPIQAQKDQFKNVTVIGRCDSTVEKKIEYLKKGIVCAAASYKKNHPESWHEKPRVLISFTSDPYQELEMKYGLTRDAIRILGGHQVPVTILTKNPLMALRRDHAMFKLTGAILATSIVWSEEESRKHWEPGASSIEDRFRALQLAKEYGIATWVSIEPVIDPKQGIEVVRNLICLTDLVKIGPIDKRWDPEHHAAGDWADFLEKTIVLLGQSHINYYIKDSLWAYATPEILAKYQKSRGYAP